MIGSPSAFENIFQCFMCDESGATAIEYALIASGIFLAILLAVNNMASSIQTMFNNAALHINPAL